MCYLLLKLRLVFCCLASKIVNYSVGIVFYFQAPTKVKIYVTLDSLESLFKRMSVTKETRSEIEASPVNDDEERRVVKLTEKGRSFKLQCLLEEKNIQTIGERVLRNRQLSGLREHNDDRRNVIKIQRLGKKI